MDAGAAATRAEHAKHIAAMLASHAAELPLQVDSGTSEAAGSSNDLKPTKLPPKGAQATKAAAKAKAAAQDEGSGKRKGG